MELPDFPFVSRQLDVDGGVMHYLDEGEGAPFLLLHGEPTWSFLWRNVIPALPGRKIAPDLIGFGRSDKPSEVSWYSYDRHVASIAGLVAALGLSGITLVVHDWGGPIGLRFAVEHPELVDRLVIMDTGLTGGAPPSERWLQFREVVRRLGHGLDVGRLVEAGTARGLADGVRAAYDFPFRDASKAGALAFPELVPTEPEHVNTAPMNRVREALRGWRKPTLVLWGAEDTVLAPSLARAFAELIPGAREPIVLTGAGHFLQEDRPDAVAAAVCDFVGN